ncbi:MAG TPA: orotidine-5'-phosphate decarboxylase [Acidimicrobiia bacterium]|nr:orotidine-5'-phosphate decarboxylase [Acidimicrobiia bacterium]
MTELFVALDFDSSEKAVRVASDLVSHVDGFKVGLELLLGPGPATIAAVRQLGKPIFADAKLHDIPNTVGGAARQLGRLGARYVSAHAAGGQAMMEAAVEGLGEGASGHPAGILAITVLTSIDDSTLRSTGVGGTPGEQVARLSRAASASGCAGVVCAVKQLGVVVQVAPELLRVAPGIRQPDSSKDDQMQASTAEEAVARGADIIVVGRPITRAADPKSAAAAFRETVLVASA